MVGSLVGLATENNTTLAEIPLEEFQKLSPDLDEKIYGVLGVKNAIAAFKSYGSTAPDQVKSQISAWKTRLGL